METISIRVFVLLLIAFVSSTVGTVVAEPSRDETIAWLRREFLRYSVSYTVTDTDERKTTAYKSFVDCSFDDGRLTLRQETNGAGVKKIRVDDVLLRDLSPKCKVAQVHEKDSVYTPLIYDLILNSSRPDTIADEMSVTGLGSLKGNISQIRIPFADQEQAERIKRAFEHLITISGGKPEAF